MYIDATRLENVLAKVKNMHEQYSNCRFIVVAEWDALGKVWHDGKRRILDSLLAPVKETIFLRGEKNRRPPNAQLKRASLKNLYQPSELKKLYNAIRESIDDWL